MLPSRFAALAAVTLLGACAPRGATPLPSPSGDDPGADPYATCWAAEPGPDDDPTPCLRTIEAGLLAGSGGRARRTGHRLELRTADTVVAEFTDQAGEGDEAARYRYAGWLAAVGQHVILVDLYEGGGVLAVDGGTARVAALLGRPVVSPDAARVAAANTDLVAAYTGSGVQVWRVTPEGLELEWALDGGGRWGGASPRWLGRDRLEFTFHTLDPATMELLSRPATLELRDDGFAVRLGR